MKESKEDLNMNRNREINYFEQQTIFQRLIEDTDYHVKCGTFACCKCGYNELELLGGYMAIGKFGVIKYICKRCQTIHDSTYDLLALEQISKYK